MLAVGRIFLMEKRSIQSLESRLPASSAEEFLFTTPKLTGIGERFSKKSKLESGILNLESGIL